MTTERCDVVSDLAAGFVLDALTPDEERLVREHLSECAEPHHEFAELAEVVPYLAESVEMVQPPASLKTRVIAAAAADLETRQLRSATPEHLQPAAHSTAARVDTPTPGSVTPFPSAEEREARSARRRPLRWLAGLAAVIAIVALGGWNLALQRDLGAARDSQRGLAADLDVARDYQRGLAAVLDVAADEGSQAAILSAADGGGPTGIAAVGADGQVAIVMRDLAPTTGSQVYEAWLIASKDAAPVPIGSFTVGANGTAAFTVGRAPTAAGVALALTREPGPDATTPTLPIVAQGTAASPDL